MKLCAREAAAVAAFRNRGLADNSFSEEGDSKEQVQPVTPEFSEPAERQQVRSAVVPEPSDDWTFVSHDEGWHFSSHDPFEEHTSRLRRIMHASPAGPFEDS